MHTDCHVMTTASGSAQFVSSMFSKKAVRIAPRRPQPRVLLHSGTMVRFISLKLTNNTPATPRCAGKNTKLGHRASDRHPIVDAFQPPPEELT